MTNEHDKIFNQAKEKLSHHQDLHLRVALISRREAGTISGNILMDDGFRIGFIMLGDILTFTMSDEDIKKNYGIFQSRRHS